MYLEIISAVGQPSQYSQMIKLLIDVCLKKLFVNYFCCMQEMTFHIIPTFCFSLTALGDGRGG